MKSKVVAALVATMAVGATCAFAANPFVDVPSDSWAYKSVVELADAGIIQGVDGQYFQGQRNITRYEAAEMVAKAMAHMDKASVEQRALINKLADEYADELNNLGVRVSNLENRVGNVKLTGDARIRYRYQNDNSTKENDKSWDYRVRLRANAYVNDKTTVTFGISSNNHNFGSNGASSANEDDNDIYTDMAKVDYNFTKNLNLSVGRDSLYVMGNAYGYNYGDVFDRAQLKYNNGKIAATAGYGKFKEGDDAAAGGLLGVKTGYGELEGFFSNGSAVGVYYNDFTRAGDASGYGFRADDLWGAYTSINLGSKFNVLANYEKINADKTAEFKADPEVWIGKLTYGKAAMATPKSWDLWVEYLDAEAGAFIGGSTNSWRFADDMDNIKSWGAGVDYTFAKNAMFSVMSSFGTETKDGNAKDPEEQTRAQFVFAF
ncbi:S-layer homology domain-containing protein [Megasphaera cerevisiae]|uniref:S-layer homology domain-containing protein n=1 Tax=Megasphaera cerevisiae TaxID=39029 RepID=UPI0009428215|nr:S-layer homology domain-containing protein [Megasphaera cerevisiae]OKY53804.1 outer membrane insertion signal [Megasphaera cerevisiae]